MLLEPPSTLPAGVVDPAPVHERLGLGLVLPVVVLVPDRERQRRRHVDEGVPRRSRAGRLRARGRTWTGRALRRLASSAAGRAAADDDVVVAGAHGRRGSLASAPPSQQRARKPDCMRRVVSGSQHAGHRGLRLGGQRPPDVVIAPSFSTRFIATPPVSAGRRAAATAWASPSSPVGTTRHATPSARAGPRRRTRRRRASPGPVEADEAGSSDVTPPVAKMFSDTSGRTRGRWQPRSGSRC